MSDKKRRPGIPHEALAFIAESSGGIVTSYLNGRETWVRLAIGSKIFEAPNNTALLIDVLASLRVEEEVGY